MSVLNKFLPNEELYEMHKIIDNTPNEMRFISDNKYDAMIFYPFANQYPLFLNGNRSLVTLPNDIAINNSIEYAVDKFENILRDQQIIMAIKFLQVNALEKFISKDYKFISSDVNPFKILFHSIYLYKYNSHAYLEIGKILIENYSDASDKITNVGMKFKIRKNIEEDEFICVMQNLLPIDANNICKYCMLTEPLIDLIKICHCIENVHVNCLLQWLQTNSEQKKCEICGEKYKLNDKCYNQFSLAGKTGLDCRTYLPHHDFYPEPLMSNSTLYKRFGMDRLKMAIMYLQVDRVKELLQDPEILDALPTYCVDYCGVQQSILCLLFANNIGDNYMRQLGDNDIKYNKIIIELVKTKKINVMKPNEYNITIMDHAKRNKKDKWLHKLLQDSY